MTGWLLQIGQWILMGLFIVTAVSGLISYRHRKMFARSGSVLLAYYTNGASVRQLASGKIAKMRLSTIVTDSPTGGALLYRVDLPFKTKLHLLGVPKNSNATQLDPTGKGSVMERVVLEGDYGNYFSLYADTGLQTEARYVLDPAAMAFTVDFCQSHNWEIIGGDLYFLQQDRTGNPGDPTDMYDDINQFVLHIQPALMIKGKSTYNPADEAYGVDDRTDILCPVCGELLTNNQRYFTCPRQHGILLSGKMLPLLASGALKIQNSTYLVASSPTHDQTLTCPSCNHDMHPTKYNGADVTIQTCSHCQYRWLNNDDIVRIAQ
jgi:Zn-finger nucleic acid-binding protein